MLVAAEDGVDICDASAASAAVVGIIGHGEESDAGFEVTTCSDLAVEVMDYRN